MYDSNSQTLNGRILALRTLLTQHAPACAQESAHRDRMLALLDSPGDPLSRDHFEPGHFTASGFVVSPDGKSVLLILHRKLNRWLQPGGHVDPGDADLFDAACREVAEETGLTGLRADLSLPGAGVFPGAGAGAGAFPGAGVFDVDIHPIPARKAEPAHEHFDVRFLLQARSSRITRNDETHDAEWTLFADLADRMTDVDEQRVIRKLAGLVSQ
jgi:8-oxo-dGTP pyrophosphatase MutT (NUDIX family)